MLIHTNHTDQLDPYEIHIIHIHQHDPYESYGSC